MEYDVVRLVQLPNGLQIDITTKVLRNSAVCAILFLWNLRNARKPPVLGQLDAVPEEKSTHGRGFPMKVRPILNRSHLWPLSSSGASQESGNIQKTFETKSQDEPKWRWVRNLVPLVNLKIAGKWMFITLKMVLIGIDP